jgi:hypothetical protein
MNYIFYIDTNAIDANVIDTNAIDANAIDANVIDTNIINSSFYDSPKIKHVISEAECNKLEKKHYSLDSKCNNTCPITQMEFLANDEIIELPCNHCFSPSAIKKWLTKEKGECPVCRYKFVTIEITTPDPVPAIAPAIYNADEYMNIFNNLMASDIIYLNIFQ